MKRVIQAVLISGAVGLTAIAVAPPAFAQMDIGFRIGDVTVAYRDGYWDRDHHWHKWRNDSDWRSFRENHPAHYHDYQHDRDEHGHDHDH